MSGTRIPENFKLSPLQEGMLFNSVYSPRSGVDLLLGVVEIDEVLEQELFEQAWQRVAEQHPALRTSMRWKGLESPVQDVHPDVSIPIRREDWSGIDEAEQERRWKALMRRDRAEGFDLSKPPLTRLTIVRLAPERHRVLWNIHHAMIDTGAMTTVLRQVFGLYDTLRRGEPMDAYAFDSYPHQGAYSEWFETLDVDAAEGYWKDQLQGLTGPTRLWIDRGKPKEESTHGVHGVELLRLPAGLTSSLGVWAGENKLTLNSLIQGTWALLLSRYSGDSRVVFGAVKSCRRSCIEDADKMVGIVLNTLPFAIDVDPDTDVVSWLSSVREKWVTLRKHEHTPLVRIKEWCDYVGRAPLFDSLVCFDAMEYGAWLRTLDPSWETRHVDIWGQPDMPLALNAYGGETLLFRITYDPRRFEQAAIRRMLEHMQASLESILSSPGVRVGELSILPAKERKTLLEDWNDTAVAYPAGECLQDLFEAQVSRSPDAVAVVVGSEEISYRELDRRSDQLANCLRESGIGPDRTVGICVERSLSTPLAILAVLKAGGAYVPLDPRYPTKRLRYMLDKASIPVIITQASTREQLRELAAGLEPEPEILCLDGDAARIGAHSTELTRAEISPENLAYVLFTSGSMGRPKGVAMPHATLVNLMRWQYGQSELGVGTRTLQFAPISFDVSWQEIFSTLGSGGTLVMIDEETRLNPEALLALLDDRSVNRVFLPFVALKQLVDLAVDRGPMPRALKEVITAGEPLRVDPAVVEFFESLPDCSLINHYGPTECHAVTTATVTGPPETWPSLPPIGRPVANTRVFLLDANMQPTPIGVAGELFVAGAAMARGYIDDEELTRERFLPNTLEVGGGRLYRTGDLVRYQENGALDFLGRTDNQVKLRGFRVELGEIESVLLEHPAVGHSAVVVREDMPGDQRLVGYFVAAGEQAPDPVVLREHLKQRLPAFMVPSALMSMDSLPLSPSGKVDRRSLPAPHERQLTQAYVAPGNETEATMAEIWSEILKVDRVGTNDDFFDLGGHSLLGMRVVSRLRETFGIEMPLEQLFDHATIAGMSQKVETLVWAASSVPSEPLSDEQEELEF